jgi:hypothetical protein
MTTFPSYPNQGQMIASNWDNVAGLRNITAYFGTDGLRFLPVQDRNGYTGGVERTMNTGGVLHAGFPVVRWTSPWISDGQIRYLWDTLLSDTQSGNVTIATHTPLSVGASSSFNFNAVLNLRLNQLQTLTRKGDGYRDFVWELVIVEVL